MARQKHIIYKVPIFNQKVVLIYYSNINYANKILNKYKLESNIEKGNAGLAGYEYIEDKNKDKKLLFFVAIKQDNNLNSLRNTITHEVTHLTQDILEQIGIDFKKNSNNECYSYTNAWLNDILIDYFTQ
jgi:hypothetical protein